MSIPPAASLKSLKNGITHLGSITQLNFSFCSIKCISKQSPVPSVDISLGLCHPAAAKIQILWLLETTAKVLAHHVRIIFLLRRGHTAFRTFNDCLYLPAAKRTARRLNATNRDLVPASGIHPVKCPKHIRGVTSSMPASTWVNLRREGLCKNGEAMRSTLGWLQLLNVFMEETAVAASFERFHGRNSCTLDPGTQS